HNSQIKRPLHTHPRIVTYKESDHRHAHLSVRHRAPLYAGGVVSMILSFRSEKVKPSSLAIPRCLRDREILQSNYMNQSDSRYLIVNGWVVFCGGANGQIPLSYQDQVGVRSEERRVGKEG